MRLDARQVARDEAKRGPKGKQGERGARGERGPAGARGAAGKPAADQPTVIAFKIKDWRLVSFLSDGRPGPDVDFRPMFEKYHNEAGGGS